MLSPMIDHVYVEQFRAWLARAGEGRSFDYLHGFLTGIACAPVDFAEIDADIVRLGYSQKERAELEALGLDLDELDEALAELVLDISDDLSKGMYRPFMGRYLGRIKPDSLVADWCAGFLHCWPFYEPLFNATADGEGAGEAEAPPAEGEPESPVAEAKLRYLSVLILNGYAEDIPPEELDSAREQARERLRVDLCTLYALMRAGAEGEHDHDHEHGHGRHAHHHHHHHD